MVTQVGYMVALVVVSSVMAVVVAELAVTATQLVAPAPSVCKT